MPNSEGIKKYTSDLSLICQGNIVNEYRLKRVMDIILSFVGIIISLPLSLIISFLIYCEDRGAILYSQKRVGKDGVLFDAPKFRTMIENSDDLYGPVQATINDPRITTVGKILRNTALDEIPQLWCIFKGDMSFVGPRALAPAEIESGKSINTEFKSMEEIPGYRKRVLVRPGLTGIAQIFAPRDINRKNKFRYDSIYINNMGLIFDLKLIILSFLITFLGRWEKRGGKFSIFNN